MTSIANARAANAGALKARQLFRAEFTPDYASRTTPCAQCKWFYAENLRTRGRKWPACNLSATRDPGRTCRWFVREKGVA